MTGRLSRWALQLSEYDFIARYLRGEDNVCADFLSRGGIEMDRDMFRRVREYALILSEYAFSIQRFGDGQKEVLLVTTRKMARELEEKARLAQTEVQKNETPPKKLERKSRRPRRAPVEVKSEEDIDEELEDEEQVQQELNSQLLSEIEEAFKFLSATRSYDELLSDNSTVIDGQKSDPKLRKIYKAVMDSSKVKSLDAPSKRIVNTGLCSVSEGVLMYDGKMWIPESLRHDFLVLQHTHAFALHQGSERMWKQCRERYYWPKMRRDIDDFVKRCHTCQLVRDGRDKKAGVYLQFPAYEPWEIVHMDLVGPLPTTASGNRYLLTCMDRFSHYVCVTPLPDMEAHTVAIAFLDNWIYRFGVPEKVLTDNGKQFVSRVAELVSKVFGYKRVFTTAWHPETNGQLERWHLYFKRRIVAFATERGFDLTSAECDGFPWDLIAKACEAAYNSTPPKMLKVSPFELIFGTRMALPADIPLGIAYTRKNDSDGLKSMKKLLQTHLRVIRDEARQTQATYDAQRQRRALKIRREHKFAIGDMVLLYVGDQQVGNTRKLTPNYVGPWRVVALNSSVNVRIHSADTGEFKNVHVSKLKLYHMPNSNSVSDNTDEEKLDDSGSAEVVQPVGPVRHQVALRHLESVPPPVEPVMEPGGESHSQLLALVHDTNKRAFEIVETLKTLQSKFKYRRSHIEPDMNTPVELAWFFALSVDFGRDGLKVLDLGAGIGMVTAALRTCSLLRSARGDFWKEKLLFLAQIG
jgi:transposase InsO family protein